MNKNILSDKIETNTPPVNSGHHIFSVLVMILPGFFFFFSLLIFKNLIILFLFYYLLTCLVIPLADMLLAGKKNVREIFRFIGLVPLHSKRILFGLLTGSVMTTIMVLAFFFLKNIFFSDNRILTSLESWGIPAGNAIVVIIVMLVFNGAVEELFWRGYLHARFKALKNRKLAVALPAAFFCALHYFVISSIISNPLAIVLSMTGIGIAGLIWGIMREYDTGLAACMVSHMLVTAGYLAIFYIFILD